MLRKCWGILSLDMLRVGYSEFGYSEFWKFRVLDILRVGYFQVGYVEFVSLPWALYSHVLRVESPIESNLRQGASEVLPFSFLGWRLSEKDETYDCDSDSGTSCL